MTQITKEIITGVIYSWTPTFVFLKARRYKSPVHVFSQVRDVLRHYAKWKKLHCGVLIQSVHCILYWENTNRLLPCFDMQRAKGLHSFSKMNVPAKACGTNAAEHHI